MKYKVTENENVSTVFLDGEIDMDVADNVREIVFPLIDLSLIHISEPTRRM